MLRGELYVHCVQRLPKVFLGQVMDPAEAWKNSEDDHPQEIVVHLVDNETLPAFSLSLRVPQERSAEFPVGRRYELGIREVD